jgi:peptide/nickel transport system permease protein
MVRFLALRLLAAVPVMGVVAVVVFLLLRISGQPGALLAGDSATPEQIAAINAQLGLARPIHEQFAIWVGQMLSGDLGFSYHSRLPVARLIAGRVEPTLSLAAVTVLLSLVVALPMGVVAAWRHGRLADRAAMAFSVIGFSVPVFVLGYIGIYVFSMRLDWLPVQGFVAIGDGLVPFLRHIALPAVTLSIVYIALLARITRTSVLEALGQDYIRTAYAKGASTRTVLIRHALRNAAVPIVSVIGIGLVLLIGGVVVTESVFNIPGIGRLIVDAVLNHDYPIIQGVLLVLALVYVGINLLIDLLYVLLDPRIRY